MTLLIFSIATRNCTTGTLGRKKLEKSVQTLYQSKDLHSERELQSSNDCEAKF